MTIWADYSAGRPGGAALRAAGFAGVIRYVGTPGHTKNITAAEYADLVAEGLSVLLVYELGTTDWQGGYNAGVANADAAAIDAHNCGIPLSVGIAASVDMHLNASQVPMALNYLRGFQAALGRAQTGAYGFAEFVNAVHAAGTASWLWRCGSAPSAAESTYTTFWQRNAGQTTMTVGGIVCDINDQLNPIGVDDIVTPDDIAAVAKAVWDQQFSGLDPLNNNAQMDSIAARDWLATTNRWANAAYTEAAAVNGTLPEVQTAILAALPTAGASMSDAQVAELEAKLIAALGAGWNVAITPKASA
jgi:hypothetical protein